MNDPVANAILNQYFRRLDQALSRLGSERRTQIVEDLRAHIQECLLAAPDQSDATVLAILDRVGDPDEIAREALADESAGEPAPSPADSNGVAPSSTVASRRRVLSISGLSVLLVAAVVLAITLSSGRSAASARHRSASVVNGRLTAANTGSAGSKGGWLPASDVSGDHATPGASSCGPQTTSGSEPANVLEGDSTKVASGSIDGHAWSLWSRKGQSGANALEDGGVVIDGTGHGLCPGFPNPGEMEMLEPPGGGDGIAYGVVGYPGTAKVAIYRDTFGNFATTKLVGSTTAQKVNGVGFFVARLAESACEIGGVEMNTASSSAATEHNLAFASGDCKAGELVPISDSQGIWGLSPKGFPDKLQEGGSGAGVGTGALKNGWLPAADISGGGGIDDSECGPQTLSGSEPATALEATATKIASGTTAGHAWSVWSKRGESGATGLEDGGVVVGGVAHGLCPGFPNPAEMELLEPSGGGDGIAYGVVGYSGAAKVAIYRDTFGSFAATKLVGSITSRTVNGVGFFVASLSESACDIAGVEMNSASRNYAAEHNLAFTTSDCKSGELVPISDSQGEWQLPDKYFPNKFQSLDGSEGRLSTPTVGGDNGRTPPWRTGPDFSSCSPSTSASLSGHAMTSIPGATRVASGTVGGRSWSLWSKRGEKGSAALEDAGVILAGHAYGICPGVRNPAEFELIDPPGGGHGVVIGVSGYDGPAQIRLSVGVGQGSFATKASLYRGRTVPADGTGFFIAQLPRSACRYSWLVLDATARTGHSQHLLGFGGCSAGRLSQISGGQGAWSA